MQKSVKYFHLLQSKSDLQYCNCHMMLFQQMRELKNDSTEKKHLNS